MRILVVTHMFPNLSNPAAGSFVIEQVSEVRSRCEVRVVAPLPAVPRAIRGMKPRWDGFWNTPFHETLASNVEVYRPRYFCLPKNASLLVDGFSYTKAIARTVDQIYKSFRFDILHVHGAVPDGRGVLLANRSRNVPVVLNIHGRDIYSTARMSPFHRRLVGSVLAGADKVVAVSARLKELIVELFPGIREPIVIHDGMDTRLFAPDGASETGVDRSSGGPLVLAVGYLIARKNHKAVISAISRLREVYPNIRLKIVGAGPEERNLRSLSQKLGVTDIVEFLGLCSRERVRQLMSECDVFALPSWDEAFGIVYIEAMSQGKPVIGCRHEGIEEFATDGETGFLVSPHDIDELTGKIRLLIEDRAMAERVGKAARQHVLMNFTWQKNVDQLMKVYRELAGQGQTSGERGPLRNAT
jgi:teichuronic acid biosynthesis glycosyltransferase TuaC